MDVADPETAGLVQADGAGERLRDRLPYVSDPQSEQRCGTRRRGRSYGENSFLDDEEETNTGGHIHVVLSDGWAGES